MSTLRLPDLLLLSILTLLSLPGNPASGENAERDPAEIGIFGIGSSHAFNRNAGDLERWVPQMHELGLRYYRSGPTSWGQVEPRQGEWHWAELDGHMDFLEKKGIIFGGLLYGNAPWNEADPPRTLPVNNITAWENYVTAVVKHANGRIKRWEVWNEPPNGTGPDQTAADYAKIVMAAYRAAKAADPSCLIGLAAKSAHINYLDQAIQAGAKDHFDYITLHPYEILGSVAADKGTEPLFMNIVPSLRKMLAVRNPEKAAVPVIFTELGNDSRNGEQVQAAALVKAYAMSIAQGVASVQWYEGIDGDSGPLGLLDRHGRPRPSYVAMEQLITHLGQHPEAAGWLILEDSHPAFLFEGNAGKVLITWGSLNAAKTLDFGAQAKALDPLTGVPYPGGQVRVSSTPVLVLDPPATMVEAARHNPGKTFRLNKDYSSEAVVSFSITEGRNTSDGLHSLSATELAKDVVGYGGSARSGGVPGGNLFFVDPTFLSYTSVPLEITVVVRRNESNDNAGFKLVYESTDGFKTAGGWYTIPDSPGWHTKTWRIDDPQFVSYWSYHFSLVSDGDEFNRYYLKSVTVKKAGTP